MPLFVVSRLYLHDDRWKRGVPYRRSEGRMEWHSSQQEVAISDCLQREVALICIINNRTGIDMDRIDYLLRDSHYVAMKYLSYVDGVKHFSEL